MPSFCILVFVSKNCNDWCIPHQKKVMVPQSSSEKLHEYLLHFTVSYNQPVTQQNCSKSTSIIKVSTMKNMNDFHYKRKLSWVFCFLFVWIGNEGRHWQVHEKCIVCTALCQKSPLELEWCQTVKKKQPIALAAIELCLS